MLYNMLLTKTQNIYKKHWILVAINAKTEYIYFMDPAPMTNNAYYKNVKAFIET